MVDSRLTKSSQPHKYGRNKWICRWRFPFKIFISWFNIHFQKMAISWLVKVLLVSLTTKGYFPKGRGQFNSGKPLICFLHSRLFWRGKCLLGSKFLVIVKCTFRIKFKQSSFINQCKELIPFINEAVICVCRRLIYILLHLWTQPHLRVLETHPTNSSTDDGLFSFSDITF